MTADDRKMSQGENRNDNAREQGTLDKAREAQSNVTPDDRHRNSPGENAPSASSDSGSRPLPVESTVRSASAMERKAATTLDGASPTERKKRMARGHKRVLRLPTGRDWRRNGRGLTVSRKGGKTSGGGIFRPPYAAVTIGLLVSMLASSFDQTAVTAIMPRIVADLGSVNAYSLTFVATYATSIVGMVLGGIVTDKLGARTSLIGSAVILTAGLILAIFAPDMAVFLISRAIQGIGVGGLIVAIYAVIAVVYPPRLRPAVFSAFAGAYVLPALVGPGLAGLLTVWFSWHAVFVFITVILVIAQVLVIRATSTMPVQKGESSGKSSKMLIAALFLAAGTSILNASSQVSPLLCVLLVIVGLVIMFFSLLPLVPEGTVRAKHGIPRLIVTRGLMDTFFTVEIYIPLLLSQMYGLGPTMTGLALTASGLLWFVGSETQARRGETIATPSVFRVGFIVMVIGVLMCFATAAFNLHWLVTVLGWGIASAGMGFIYPRLNSVTLGLASAQQTGFVASALQVMGVVGTTTMVSFAALIQVFGATLNTSVIFGTIFLIVTLMSLPLWVLWHHGVGDPQRWIKTQNAS